MQVQVQKPTVTVKQVAVISHCAAEYLRALLNPFTGPLACVPVPPAIESRKVRSWVKASFAIGSGGFGFAFASPIASITTSQFCCYASTSAYAGSVMTQGGVGVQGYLSNAQFVNGDFGNSLATPNLAQARIVASGLRVRYTGTELNKSGLIYPWHHRTNGDLENEGINAYYAFQGSEPFQVTRNWTCITWSPKTVADWTFSGPLANITVQPIGIMISGVPGNTYELEFTTIAEITGPFVGAMTPTHSDANAFQAMQEISAQDDSVFGAYVGSASANIKQGMNDIAEFLKNGVSAYRSVQEVANINQAIQTLVLSG